MELDRVNPHPILRILSEDGLCVDRSDQLFYDNNHNCLQLWCYWEIRGPRCSNNIEVNIKYNSMMIDQRSKHTCNIGQQIYSEHALVQRGHIRLDSRTYLLDKEYNIIQCIYIMSQYQIQLSNKMYDHTSSGETNEQLQNCNPLEPELSHFQC